MSASMSSQQQLVACPFTDPPDKFYVCYKSEICCKEGCCSIYSYKYFHSWYFWLALLVLFALYRYGCMYCKKLEDDQCRHDHAIEMRQRALLPFRNARQQRANQRQRSAAARSLSQPTSEAKQPDPPPDYIAALALPQATNRPTTDDVPTYEEAVAK